MAAASRDSSSALTGQISVIDEGIEFQNLRKMLDEEPFRVHFFQAVRMLQTNGPGTQASRIFCHAARGDDPLLGSDFARVSSQRDLPIAAHGKRADEHDG